MARKRIPRGTPQPTLNSLLKQRLGIRVNSKVKLGRVDLDVLTEDTKCEGICTPETDGDYRALDSPMSSDFFARGSCGPSLLTRGLVIVKQTLRTEEGRVERVCCLTCARQAGLLKP
jgi:hypothetical protein